MKTVSKFHFKFSEIMLQNEIMADHRTINQSFRGNFFRRRNYDGPRAYQIAPDLTCSYDNQCAGYPLAICHSVCQCVKGALNTGTTCIASSTGKIFIFFVLLHIKKFSHSNVCCVSCWSNLHPRGWSLHDRYN